MSSICCLHIFPGGLFYTAVICIVPVLGLPVMNVGSIVPIHCSTRVHCHCIQSVLAVILGKVFWECFKKDLREVEGFWKSDSAIKFLGVTTDIPKSFQVHAQDRRQGTQSDSLFRWSLDFTLCTKAAIYVPQLLVLKEGCQAAFQRIVIFLDMQRQAEQVAGQRLDGGAL